MLPPSWPCITIQVFRPLPTAPATLQLQAQQEGEGLHAVVAPVHVVAQEQVVGVRHRPADPEQLQQVIQLPAKGGNRKVDLVDETVIFF